MDEELKACPFCGGEPNLTHSDYVHDDLRPMPVVECKSCSAWVRAEDWNTRANPASQGGEAVAWRVTGRDGLTITAQYPEWAEADCLLTITPLYTHPADQVDSVVVPVELLERAAYNMELAEMDGPTYRELRALLAKP